MDVRRPEPDEEDRRCPPLDILRLHLHGQQSLSRFLGWKLQLIAAGTNTISLAAERAPSFSVGQADYAREWRSRQASKLRSPEPVDRIFGLTSLEFGRDQSDGCAAR
jgi:hypothetical protein